MKKSALVCALAALALPVFAACSNNDAAEANTPLPPEEIVTPLIPEEREPSAQEEANPQEEAGQEQEEAQEANATAPAVAQYLKITTDNLNVRKGAGTSYSALGSVEKNILMQYAGKSGDWYETRYMGAKAFVHSSYAKIVTLEKGNDKVEQIIAEGLNVLGTPYVYGATRLHDGKGNLLKGFSEKKFDCSSLMQFMFFRGANILLNMNTRTQVTQGKEVSSLQRGDLMFFTNASRKNNKGIERIGHVALYLGDNYILHTASDYAKIEQISSTRWSYFICARRML